VAVNGKNAIAVDWDGTCVEEVWPERGEWLAGAREALGLLADTFDVYIWSTRIVNREYEDWHRVRPDGVAQSEIDYIRTMLDRADLQDVHIFESYPDHGVGKISVKAYVDDKAIRYEGDWNVTYMQILAECG
jgi:hypothetical protein